jgi:hypothetical protein
MLMALPAERFRESQRSASVVMIDEHGKLADAFGVNSGEAPNGARWNTRRGHYEGAWRPQLLIVLP